MLTLLMLPRWLYVFLGSTLLCMGCYFAGDYHGTQAEKNSLENKQRAAIIVNQNLTINKLQQDKIIQDNAIIQLQKENDKLQQFNEKIQDEIKKDETIINRTNWINGYFLLIIQDAARGHPVSKNPASSGAVNDPTRTYKPSEVDAAIANAFGQCNAIRNILIQLQDEIRKQVTNANR